MDTRKRSRVAAGVSLILMGLTFLALQWWDGATVSSILVLIGALLVAAYFYARNHGFLIPGCLLLGLSLGRGDLVDWGDPNSSLGLGLAFVAIYLIPLLYERRSHWWPLIPGGVLILNGLGREDVLRYLLTRGWPWILVVIGVLLLLGVVPRTGRSSDRAARGP